MNFLDRIVPSIQRAIDDGFYSTAPARSPRIQRPLGALLQETPFALIPVIERRSPVEERLFEGDLRAVAQFANDLAGSGAPALSVVCERDYFSGNLRDISAAGTAGVPVLYKDFVIDPLQLEAAAAHGADAVLLILDLFARGHCSVSIDEMVRIAHGLGVETLLEVFNQGEFERAMETETDFIGINNRDLKSLNVDLLTTSQILSNVRADRPVISESGVKSRADIEHLIDTGVQGVLVGTSILKSTDPVKTLRELLGAEHVIQS